MNGHEAGQIGFSDQGHPVLDHRGVVFGQFTVASALHGHVKDDRTRLEAFYHRFGDQDRGFLSRDLRRGNDDVGSRHARSDQFQLLAVMRFAQFLGVTPRVLRLLVRGVQRDKLRPQAFHLPFDHGAGIESLHHRSQPFGRGDGLQSGHAGSQDQNPGRGDRARGGHEHGEKPLKRVGRHQYGLVSSHGGHGTEHVHVLGAGDPRHHLHAHGGQVAGGQFFQHSAPVERLQQPDQRGAFLHLRYLIRAVVSPRGGGHHLDDQVGAAQHGLVGRCDFRSAAGVVFIGMIGTRPRAALQHDFQALFLQFFDGIRDQSDPVFSRKDFFGYANFHRSEDTNFLHLKKKYQAGPVPGAVLPRFKPAGKRK